MKIAIKDYSKKEIIEAPSSCGHGVNQQVLNVVITTK